TGRYGSIEALEVFRAEPGAFDLVITDMTMPEITGDRLARTIKTIRPDIPVILSTGFSEKIDEKVASDLPIASLLMKPVNKVDMAESVRKALDSAGS
ncbi:MAG: response regulator, partial [Thermodesulfobacteriota bacterium]